MASTSVAEIDQVVIDDSMVSRNRIGRTLFAAVSAVALISIPTLTLGKIAVDWISYPAVGYAVGAALGLFAFSKLYDKRMEINVDSNHAFFTTDNLRAFFGLSDVYTAYGPGKHISWPWEKRERKNNVALTEASENFEVRVLTNTGTVYLKGSFRIRPRFETQALVAFVGGVAVIAEDLSDLIRSFITDSLGDTTIEDTRKSIALINEKLEKNFAKGAASDRDPRVSKFEERFGIVVGDVTIAEIRLSEEAEKTRTAADEAAIIVKGAALLLGFATPEDMQSAVKSGALKQNQLDRARKDFMAISDNIKMTHTSTDFNLRVDADPKVADALANSGPAIAALAQQLARTSGNNNPKGGA